MAEEAADAMLNWEMLSTDQFDGYAWDEVRSCLNLPQQILVACAEHKGCLAVTSAVLQKSNLKSFGGKQNRRDAIGVAFSAACAAGNREQVDFFLGLIVRHVDDGLVAAVVADMGQTNARIASSAFNHGAAGFERAAFFGFLNHPQRGAIFNRAAGVHEFCLP